VWLGVSDIFRIYDRARKDGYPAEWHSDVKHLVRAQAENRCERCAHPYVVGEQGSGEWSHCDERCTHSGEVRIPNIEVEGDDWIMCWTLLDDADSAALIADGVEVEARWRILTVHHLNGVKTDCRWWNLAALCQRCHLHIQKKVVMERVFPFEHSEWFKPHAAGWYAFAYLGEELTREETLGRMDHLLGLERVA
jgi:hypothetical protein